MKNKTNFIGFKEALFLCLAVFMIYSCSDDTIGPELDGTPRLFRPVLNKELTSQGNSIIVNIASLKGAVGYTLEISRDSYNTIEYTVQIDTNYVEINEDLVGEELFWNTLYQVRAKAHASETQYDSEFADLGAARTERFPTILNVPSDYDVTDITARVSWDIEGLPITGIKIFAPNDLKLKTPLFEEAAVDENGQASGEWIITGLEPETDYQIAIYSGATIRGWVNYTTKVADLDLSTPGVIDLSNNDDPDALINAMDMINDGDIVYLKNGVVYNSWGGDLNKSFTVQGAYGIGSQKASILIQNDPNLEANTNINYIHFKNINILGSGGNYFFVFQNPGTIGELRFDDCGIYNPRGLVRCRTAGITIDKFVVNNCITDRMGNYGFLTIDTDDNINHIEFTNSTFNHLRYWVQSKSDSKSILIENCTIANSETGRQLWRYDNNDATEGFTINNTIWGHGENNDADPALDVVKGKSGFNNTNFLGSNNYTVSNFSWVPGSEIPVIEAGNSSSTQEDLWADPNNLEIGKADFTIIDSSFPGKYDTGDPRWRVKL